MIKIAVTEKSGNKKTGKILVTRTERASCPRSCPFYDGACYARFGPLSWHWSAMEQGKTANGKEIDIDWNAAMQKIEALPAGALWRHNEAGDLPGEGENINPLLLGDLVKANLGKRGFTYTHKTVDENNYTWIKAANDMGFTINLSGNDLTHADKLCELNAGPVISVLYSEQQEQTRTPAGRKVIICPHVTHGVQCRDCKLCAISDRNFVIGFPAHGPAKKSIDGGTSCRK